MSRLLSDPRLALALLVLEVLGLWTLFVAERYVWGLAVLGVLWIHPPLLLLGAVLGHRLMRRGEIGRDRQRRFLVLGVVAVLHLVLHTVLAVNTDFRF
ncbi:MAG: hypothetical protein R3F30_15955 [Planctomycetota bacterium]